MSLLSTLVSRAGRFAARLLFEEIAAVGDMPSAEGAVLYLANHPYHLVDAIVADCVLDRRDVFYVAHSTIYEGMLFGWLYRRLPMRNPLRASLVAAEEKVRHWVLDKLGIVPIHREVDGRGDFRSQRENLRLLAHAAERLAEGHAVVIYPEGGSFGEYGLHQVKSGVGVLIERAVRRCHERGVSLKIICASTIYGSLDEPFRTRVKVRLEELPDASVQGEGKRSRQEWLRQIDETLRRNLVTIGSEDSDAASSLAELLSSDPEEGLRSASSLLRQNPFRDVIRQQALRRRAVLLSKGVRGPAFIKEKINLFWVLLMYTGFILHVVPSKVLDLLVERRGTKPHRRGYQILSQALISFLIWYLIVLSAGIWGICAGIWHVAHVVLFLLASASLSVIYPHLYVSVNRTTLRWRSRQTFNEAMALERELLGVSQRDKSGS